MRKACARESRTRTIRTNSCAPRRGADIDATRWNADWSGFGRARLRRLAPSHERRDEGAGEVILDGAPSDNRVFGLHVEFAFSVAPVPHLPSSSRRSPLSGPVMRALSP